MKSFFKKYFFFFNFNNYENITGFYYPLIASNMVIGVAIFYSYFFLFFTKNDDHDLHSLYSSLLSIPLIRFIPIWYDFKEFKKLMPIIWEKIKNSKLKYESTELYFFSSALIFLFIIFNWVFVVDWGIIGKSGIGKSGFYGFVLIILGYFHYRREKRFEKRRLRKQGKK